MQRCMLLTSQRERRSLAVPSLFRQVCQGPVMELPGARCPSTRCGKTSGQDSSSAMESFTSRSPLTVTTSLARLGVGYNATTLQQTMAYNVSPNGYGGGIWQSGGGLATDSTGNIFFTTGNGDFTANTGGRDYGDTVVKLSPGGSVSRLLHAARSGESGEPGFGSFVRRSGLAPGSARSRTRTC